VGPDGRLLIAFALTDGYDMGVGALLPFVAKTDEERRMVINTVGATWEGNQVWFITRRRPRSSRPGRWSMPCFSGFYLAMFLVLTAMILRPVGFKYRSKRPEPRWRSFWDWALFTGGFVPVLVFGVAVGNLLQRRAFKLRQRPAGHLPAGFFGLFTPFTLLCGLLSVSMLVLHGAAWLTVKVGRRRSSCRSSWLYTAWVYKVLWGKVEEDSIHKNSDSAY
jgi:cytochrome d ubiquinol oxidase subunit II